MPSNAHTWSHIIGTLIDGRDLDRDTAAWAMSEILSGAASAGRIAGFAVALRAKGETVDEVEGLVTTMYEHAEPLSVAGRIVDIVGTGGDRAKTVNISSMSAVAMAGAGAVVVKHGNRAASSSSGSADVLESLGVRLDLPPNRIAEVASEAGITFCFAPVFHSSLRFAGPTRAELGVPTTFNFLGPLTNPARPDALAVGCADARMAPIMAGVLARRGVDALVFRGNDGLDELTTSTRSTVWVVARGSVEESSIAPEDVGLERAPVEALRGGDAAHNADVFRRVLGGEQGPVRDAVVLNAAAGLVARDAMEGPLLDRMRGAAERIRESIDSGAAKGVLARWAKVTQRIADR
ncbi:MAG TPA: anthranilate phosphoribosyltransferase [Nocardioidaceae bacterium]|nr:anthranilate phosphoribosyltransferase [Nocardioidaceae bacterium]